MCVCLVFLFPWQEHGCVCMQIGHGDVWVAWSMEFPLGVVYVCMCGCGVGDRALLVFFSHLIHLFAPSSFCYSYQRCVLCGYVHRLPS